MPHALAYALIAVWAALLLFCIPFAMHRLYLLWLRWRHARRRSRAVLPRPGRGPSGALPPVTIQLPIYNEMHVVERLIDAACGVDYPRALLQVQVLDDSTDATTELVAERARVWKGRGVQVDHIRRRDRTGYKAGALAAGLERASGEFLLILDADFVAPSGLVRALLAPFADPAVGMVQARWDHLNEAENWLTRAQAFLLDAHFYLEQAGRAARGCFFNFNGTAGMWRRRCLEEAGGWQADTLTEDLDASYRAQLRGWRFVYLEEVGVPAELPRRVAAFEVQQKRWAEGGVQTARKLLPELLRGDWPLRVKLEAVVHLGAHLAHPLGIALALVLVPAALARRAVGLGGLLPLDLVLFVAATFPFLAFYAAAGRARGRGWKDLAPGIPAALAAGLGLGAPVAPAVLRGLFGRRGLPPVFVRTPKWGRPAGRGEPDNQYAAPSSGADTATKAGLGVLMLASIALALQQGVYYTVPFLALFAGAYLCLAIEGRRRMGVTSRRTREIGAASATPLRPGTPPVYASGQVGAPE